MEGWREGWKDGVYEKDREFISDRETGIETEKEKEWLRKRRYNRACFCRIYP